MKLRSTQILSVNASGLARASEILSGGGLVAFPTETVYGLGADARSDRAVAKIYEAKGRPSFNPLIAHVASLDAAMELVEFDETAKRLAEAFWPGALTLVLPLKSGSGVSKLVTAGLPTLAVRVPDHPLARTLLETFGGPVAAPSANLSGKISPTTAEHVLSGLDGKIDAVCDGGPCIVGLESTIVSTGDAPTLLRPGGVDAEAIEACIGQTLIRAVEGDVPQSPGQLLSHYAPSGAVRLNVTEVLPNEVLLGFGEVDAELNLSKSGDLIEAAANLFWMLHQLDEGGAENIAVSPIPTHGLGAAINDRLKRAAAPRG